MVYKGRLDIDSRGMIYEAYRIEGITKEECRMIFLDWAMNSPKGKMKDQLNILLDEYAKDNPSHPMTEIIQDGLQSANTRGRKGGRAGRLRKT